MRILIASLAAEGHFNPLTGVAVHLRNTGHDVRWYTGRDYAGRLDELGIPHLPFMRARELTGDRLAELFPERARLKGPALIRFDFEKVFVSNTEAYFEDLREIDCTFPFDVLLADAAFLAARLVREKLGKHVCGFGAVPILATSPDVPPNFTGLRPAKTALGRLAHRAMGAAMDRMVLANGRSRYNQVLLKHGLKPITGSVFDEFYGCQNVLFQNGVPGLEFRRRAMPPNLRHVGLLRPHRRQAAHMPPELATAGDRRIILVSQGTVDNHDPEKLIVPTIEALAPTGTLVLAATGGKNMAALRRRFPRENVLINDYIDFESAFDRVDAFVCNGGYGSILLSLSKAVPVVGAGVREGKNDINAHIEYAGVGVNLRSERPSTKAIARAVDRVLTEPSFGVRTAKIRDELASYRPLEIIDNYLESLVRDGPAFVTS